MSRRACRRVWPNDLRAFSPGFVIAGCAAPRQRHSRGGRRRPRAPPRPAPGCRWRCRSTVPPRPAPGRRCRDRPQPLPLSHFTRRSAGRVTRRCAELRPVTFPGRGQVNRQLPRRARRHLLLRPLQPEPHPLHRARALRRLPVHRLQPQRQPSRARPPPRPARQVVPRRPRKPPRARKGGRALVSRAASVRGVRLI